MPRFAFLIEYDGAPFSGWQRQPDRPSVQGAIENALRALDPGLDSIAAAGRTDAGVHAWGQVAHADLTRDWDPFVLIQAINQHLRPAPVAILDAKKVGDDWHARFAANERRYLYRVVQRRPLPAIERGKVWPIRFDLDLDAMRRGAEHLIGNHDFTTFRSTICQAKSPVKTLDEISIEKRDYPGGYEYQFRLRARSFLHNQVRSIVGTLTRVGSGSWEHDRVREALEARKRSACGPVAVAAGLYMTGVGYPDDPFS